MRKMKLDLDRLEVESFRVTGDAPTRRGTVRGHSPSTTYPVDPWSFSWDHPGGCLCMHDTTTSGNPSATAA